ncbi:MAG: DUF4450 domain-containing protein [Opitutaceae bacterium]|nr:DUF4450 domain-containing protein [Opitutaceae bacterium]
MHSPTRAPAAEPPVREPGQSVSAEYLSQGMLRYEAEGPGIVGRNGRYFNNRPLYCRLNTDGAVLTGDRPLVRLIAKPYLHGALALAVQRGSRASWLHHWADIESRYHCGRMTWRCTDPAFAGLTVTLTAVPLHESAGFAARVCVTGAQTGDRLIWSYGGARQEEGDPRLNWDPVMRGNPDICRGGDPRRPLLNQGVVPEFCTGNTAWLGSPLAGASGVQAAPASGLPTGFTLSASPTATHVARGRVSRADELKIADAFRWTDPRTLLASTGGSTPMIAGAVRFAAGDDSWFCAVEVGAADAGVGSPRIADPAAAFADGQAYLLSTERVHTTSPDARLNAAVAAVCHAVDASCERDPYVFRHGCMTFSCRFVGWRVICGATVLGWHERVLGNAVYTIGLQKSSDPLRLEPMASTERLLCHEGNGSRLYGRGALDRDFPMYDVQSQFFDQTIRDWRATADPAMERLLRPALELHLEWMQECFDPDDDGLYESYINTLPTDSVWYDGGGSAEESAYAYTAHRAAMDLARRAGDPVAAERHRRRCEKIQHAMRARLWLPERGHFGLYREQLPPHRVHDDAWTYSVFLPIDAGLCSAEEALQSLYYTEWALERIRLPYGGVLCQLSNWVPWKWSVRDMFGGDLCALALACFQTGLGDDGYALLQGVMHESAYASAVPGGFSHIGAATDFGDNVHMFARTVVEGLFGYDPDYPNGIVHLRPAFPSTWPRASITTPDFALNFVQADGCDRYQVSLTRPAALHLQLPVRAGKIHRVTLDGRETAWQVAPGFGHAVLAVAIPAATTAELVIEFDRRLPESEALTVGGVVGEEIALRLTHGEVADWRDLHGVLEHARADGPVLRGRLTAKPGHHLILIAVRAGELPRWQVCKIHITDPETVRRHAGQTPREAPADARWECLDLASVCNGDIRTVFQQRYLSPRPATCSVRLGVDGYSAWTFPYWNLPPPPIDLAHVPSLLDAAGRIITPPQVPFAAFHADRNIAFTSRWDNWPAAVTVNIGRAARTAWLLVAGTTFPMQTRIANAVLHFRYADGTTEKLELIPPFNFWMLCPWGGEDYSYEHDAFCLPPQPPPQVQLGHNCRAMVLSWKLRPGVPLADVTLETLSRDVVIGLMGVSLEL